MSVIFNKVNSFVEILAEKGIDLSGNGLTLAITNTAHTAGWTQLSDLTQVSYTNCSSRVLTVSASSQTGGTYKLVIADKTLTISGGNMGPFRYIYVYDDNSTDDKLICYYDYGASITLYDGDSFIIDFDGTNGFLQIG